jgi:multidrug efflux pump subunit AcrB
LLFAPVLVGPKAVHVEREAFDRRDISDLRRIQVRNGAAQMVPLGSIAGVKVVMGPQLVYPLQQLTYRSP